MNSPLIARNTSGLQAPVIAYPVEASSPSFTKGAHNMLQNNSSMELVGGSSLDDSMGAYSSSLGDANFADDTINISGNFFSQVNCFSRSVSLSFLSTYRCY